MVRRGYGRLAFMLGDIYKLDAAGIRNWVTSTLNAVGGAADAGYFGLTKLSDQQRAALLLRER